MLTWPWSKITLFLVVQMIQHAVVKSSLKIGLPKLVLASKTISRGGRLRFQEIGMELQQS